MTTIYRESLQVVDFQKWYRRSKHLVAPREVDVWWWLIMQICELVDGYKFMHTTRGEEETMRLSDDDKHQTTLC